MQLSRRKIAHLRGREKTHLASGQTLNLCIAQARNLGTGQRLDLCGSCERSQNQRWCRCRCRCRCWRWPRNRDRTGTGIQIGVSTHSQSAACRNVTVVAGGIEVTPHCAGAQIQITEVGQRQVPAGGDRAQRQRVAVVDAHNRARGRDRTREVIARMGERDVARACIQVAGATDRERTRLNNKAVVTGGAQVARHRDGAQIQSTGAGQRQVPAGGDRTQRQRIAVVDGHNRARGRHCPREIVTRINQRDVARAGVQVAGARDRERTRLNDMAVVAVGAQVAPHRADAQIQGDGVGQRQVPAGGDRAQRQRIAVVDAHNRARGRDRTREVIARVGERDVARACIQVAGATDSERTRLNDMAVVAGGAQIAHHRADAQIKNPVTDR